MNCLPAGLEKRPAKRPVRDLVQAGLVLLILATGALAARSQLAVTEVMSQASVAMNGIGNPDFWELTNLGSNSVDLTGYLFVDRDKLFPGGEAWVLPSLIIQPGESIIFVKGKGTNANPDLFREWWGQSNLPPSLQIIFYPNESQGGFGLDNRGDAVRLFDANSNLVDAVYFSEAEPGVSFTFEDRTMPDVKSQLGICQAFEATLYGDIGSPGYACQPSPLTITRQPVSQAVDLGMDAVFLLEATGVPAPRYQWYHNGVPLPTPATAGGRPGVINYAGYGLAWQALAQPNTLSLPNATTNQAGEYYAVVSNGLHCLTSAIVTLTVDTTPSAPSFASPLPELCFPWWEGRPQTNLVAALWQTATFGAVVRGYPPPALRWSWSSDGVNFVNLQNATNRLLQIPWLQFSQSGFYRVRATNAHGAASAYAQLTVKAKPRLKVTEVMPWACEPHYPCWWELTNYGDEPVNLYGWCWDDWPGNIGGGPTIASNVVIHPGESIILVEGWSREQFIEWWGADNLPPDLQVVTYYANGLSENGDEVNLWNLLATDDQFDLVDRAEFSTAFAGASYWFKPNDVCSEFGMVSREGDCGSFRAKNGCSVGSPGWSDHTRARFALAPPLKAITARQQDGAVVINWMCQPGSVYTLQYTLEFPAQGPATWVDLAPNYWSTSACATFTHTPPQGESQRFYRLVEVGPAPCSCTNEVWMMQGMEPAASVPSR